MASLAAYMIVACTHDCYPTCIISYQLPTPSEADKKQTPFKPNMVHRYMQLSQMTTRNTNEHVVTNSVMANSKQKTVNN